MTPPQATKDLIVLVADKSMKLAVEALLRRSPQLGFRQSSSAVVQHPEQDPGVRRRSHEFLRPYSRQYQHALAICDREGSGSEASREELETRIEAQLAENGWNDRACAVVIDPELEIWTWGDWAALTRSTRWHGDAHNLKAWLRTKELLEEGQAKPRRPKEALQAVVRQSRRGWSSAIHQEVAASADTSRCVDVAFGKLRSTLQSWFPL